LFASPFFPRGGAREPIEAAPMLVLWPGALIFVTVIAFDFLSDGLHDAVHPKAIHVRG